MKILVTGSTGLLGNNIVRQALNKGYAVRALIRDKLLPKSLQGLDIEVAHGELADKDSLCNAVAGIDAIIHCAAHLHIGWRQLDDAMRINAEGTQHLVNVALEQRAKFVHISTVNTLSVGNPEGTVDENSDHDGRVKCTYVVSKMAADEVVKQAVGRGLHASIVHPGFMLGPYDWKKSSGRMILEIAKRFTPLAPSGGCSVCDVRDVAEGTLSALQSGRSGRHYILAGENMSYMKLWTAICQKLRKRPPFTIMRLPARFIVSTLGDMSAKLTGMEGDVNSAAIEMSCQFHCYSSRRAQDELGYRIRPYEQSIDDAIQWFRSVGYLPNSESMK